MKKYNYALLRILLQITAIIFFSQLIIEVTGISDRKEGFEWVLTACLVAFLSSLAYGGILILLNSWNKTRDL